MRFREATALSEVAGGFEAELAEGWDIFGVTNGGYLMAILGRAMATRAEGRDLLSVTAHFLNRATPGRVDVGVDLLKEGRGLSTVHSWMSRDGTRLLSATGIFGDPKRSKASVALALGEPPELPPPAECPPVVPSEVAPLPPPFTGQVDLRSHPDDARALISDVKGDRPIIRGWFRLKDDEPLDALAVVQAADAFPPAIFNSEIPLGWTPTVDMTVHIHNPRPTGWLACEFTTDFITDGLVEEDGRIWDEEGRPVAFSRQLALVPN